MAGRDVLPCRPCPATCIRSKSSMSRSRRCTSYSAGRVGFRRSASHQTQKCYGRSRFCREGAMPPPQAGHWSRKRHPCRKQETRVARLQPRRKNGARSSFRHAGQYCRRLTRAVDARASPDPVVCRMRNLVSGSRIRVRPSMSSVGNRVRSTSKLRIRPGSSRSSFADQSPPATSRTRPKY